MGEVNVVGKPIGSGTLGITLAAILTPPAGKQIEIKKLVFAIEPAEDGGKDDEVKLYFHNGTDDILVIPRLPMIEGEAVAVYDEFPYILSNSQGHTLKAKATFASNVDWVAWGIEMDDQQS